MPGNTQDNAARRDLEATCGEIATLTGGCPSCTVLPTGTAAPGGCAVAVADAATSVYLHLEGVLDPATELTKLRKQIGAVDERLRPLRQRMRAAGYGDATPAEVQENDERKVGELTAELAQLNVAVQEMQSLAAQQGHEQQGAQQGQEQQQQQAQAQAQNDGSAAA